MLFNSLQFLIFFPVVTFIYFLLPHKYRWLHLLIASCVFYCAFIPIYILILFFTIVVDYIAGIYIEKTEGKGRRTFLIMSIVANVGVLAFFKYYNFFIENSNALMHLANPHASSLPLLSIILPVGLSFHTFQAMSYTIEVYRGNQKAERHFGIYALYVMFYPQLVAGPIERPQNMLHQFHERHAFNLDNLIWGLRRMLWGLFKKSVIADRLAIYVNAVYENPHSYHHGNVVLGVVFFAFQIYCDFSGYSDIALGSAQTMGFKLMTNFNFPFLYSTNISTFWRRWHISLYTWFNDYLYTPLVISWRNYGQWSIGAAIMVTFLLSGLWHGANWTFVIWGALHACALIYEMYTKRFRKKLSKTMPKWIYDRVSLIITFIVLVIIWVFFRASSLTQAIDVIRYMFTTTPKSSWFNMPTIANFGKVGITWFSMVFALIFMTMVSEHILIKNNNLFTRYALLDSIWLGLVILLIATMGIFNHNSFIYFQF